MIRPNPVTPGAIGNSGAPKDDPDPVSRRNLVATALGAMGALALTGCNEATASDSEPSDQLRQDLTGTTSIRWFDTLAEIRGVKGGTTTSSVNVAVARGYATPADGGGGTFVWTTNTTSTDNGGTIIVPTGTRTGCWKRLYDGAINVRWFGAKGDGTTNDLPAIQAAIDVGLVAGGDILFPEGYYGIISTINIGLPVLSSYDFVVTRSAPMSDADYNPHLIPGNVTLNQVKCPVSIIFEANTFIVANFAPTVATPAIAYNIANSSTSRFVNVQVIGTSTFVAGKFQQTDVPASNKVIGVLMQRSCNVIDKAFFAGLGYGLVSIGSFHCAIRDVRVEACGDAIHVAMGNALSINNIVMWSCGRGLVFDGSGSDIAQINTEQVNDDLIILGADSCCFGPGYFEDSRTSGGSGHYYVTCGHTENGLDVLHSTFRDLRIGGSSGGKSAYRLWGTRELCFLASRNYGALSTVDAISFGSLINCDFDLPADRWNKVGGFSRFSNLRYDVSEYGIVGMLAFNIPFHDFGMLAAGATITYDITVPTITIPYANYNTAVQITGAGNELIKNTARIVNSSTIRLFISNPTATIQPQAFAGSVLVTLFVLV